MRTKALLCAASVMAAGLVSTQAQVYSVNVAGYVTSQLTNGFNMIANPLAGTTTNTVALTLSNSLPLGSLLYKFVNGGWITVGYAVSGKGTGATTNWGVGGSNTIVPGEGVFLKLPLTNGVGKTNITFVGNVLQGSLTNTFVSAAPSFTLISSLVPQGGALHGVLGFNPQLGDIIYTWDPSANAGAGAYLTFGYTKSGKGTAATTNWSPSEPIISVGQGFFLKTTNTGSAWTRNFTVQ